jgi:hypothetical protein
MNGRIRTEGGVVVKAATATDPYMRPILVKPAMTELASTTLPTPSSFEMRLRRMDAIERRRRNPYPVLW